MEDESLVGEGVFCVVYVSRAHPALRRRHVDQLVSAAGRRNLRERITGFLVQAGPDFVQYLEGSRADVVACFRRIEQDTRHSNVALVACGAVPHRRFASWEMGFFIGDADGTDRLDPVLRQWKHTDTSLIEEVIRINRAAHRLRESIGARLEIAPRPVLMRAHGADATNVTSGSINVMDSVL